jgi:hypothetical protein
MGKIIDLKGKVFGRLTVIDKTDIRNRNSVVWKCKCLCGSIILVSSSCLLRKKNGKSSCGCKLKERYIGMSNGSIITARTHGMKRKRPYNIWCNMKSRCDNPKNKKFKNYGGRGIKYDLKWKHFKEFWKDMSDNYYKHCKVYGEKNTTIDRIDNNKGYNKKNCRWATWKVQENNKSNNKITKTIMKKIIKDIEKKVKEGKTKDEKRKILVDETNKYIRNKK